MSRVFIPEKFNPQRAGLGKGALSEEYAASGGLTGALRAARDWEEFRDHATAEDDARASLANARTGAVMQDGVSTAVTGVNLGAAAQIALHQSNATEEEEEKQRRTHREALRIARECQEDLERMIEQLMKEAQDHYKKAQERFDNAEKMDDLADALKSGKLTDDQQQALADLKKKFPELEGASDEFIIHYLRMQAEREREQGRWEHDQGDKKAALADNISAVRDSGMTAEEMRQETKKLCNEAGLENTEGAYFETKRRDVQEALDEQTQDARDTKKEIAVQEDDFSDGFASLNDSTPRLPLPKV